MRLIGGTQTFGFGAWISDMGPAFQLDSLHAQILPHAAGILPCATQS